MLLCLLYVLRATDCHYENLIAHGDHPVLIDAETLLYHEPQPLDDLSPLQPGELLAERLLGDSVLRTGMLPRWEADSDQATPQDVSALGCSDDQPASSLSRRWKQINTDYMHTVYEKGTLQVGHNVAHLRDKALSPLDFEAQIVTGFEQMYRLILLHRDALIGAATGPLRVMRDQAVRFVYRPTRIYQFLTASSWSPEILKKRNRLRHSSRTACSRAFLAVPNKPLAWPVLAAEIEAMEQMDVPLFSAYASGTALHLPGGVTVLAAFRRSSYSAMIGCIGQLCEADLQGQLTIVRTALHTKAAQTPQGEDPGPIRTSKARGLDREDFVAEATAIGVQIEQLSTGRWEERSQLDWSDLHGAG